MIETLTLRDYQAETVDALYADYATGLRRLASVLPTGAGKTVTFARVIADCIAAGKRALVLAHRTELIDAAVEKLEEATSGVWVGVVKGRRRDVQAPIMVGSVQTCRGDGVLALLRQAQVGLVVVDETHHVAAASYQKILRALGVFTPDGPRLWGVTATLGRSDGLALGDTFEKVSIKIPMRRLIDAGHLLRPVGRRVRVEGMDLSRIKASRTSDSGLDDRAVAREMLDNLAPAAIARAVLEHAPGRKGVTFLPSIEMSIEMARVYAEHGLTAVHVDGKTPDAVRREIFRQARLGRYDQVCNVGVATEGTDVPIWSVVVLARATSSAELFQQMAGRGARPYGDQRDYLLMDVVGSITRHNLQTISRLEGAELLDPMPDELAEFDEEEIPDDEEADGPGAVEALPGNDGALVVEMIDLFGASDTAWQRSPRGVWYLATGDGTAVFLAPAGEVDRYDVRTTDGLLVHGACDLSAAMGWGEKEARNRAKRDLARTAEWRTKKLTRAEKLEALFRGEVQGGDLMPATAGDLVGARDDAWAAAHIDPVDEVSGVTPYGYWFTGPDA